MEITSILTERSTPILTLQNFIFIAVVILGLQTLVLMVLLFRNKHSNTSFYYLSLVLFFFLLSLFNYGIFHILIRSNDVAWVPYMQLELLYGFGPSLYVYAKSLTDRSFRFKKIYWLHFALPILEFCYYRTALFRSGAIGLSERPDSGPKILYQLVQWGGIVSILIYLILTVVMLITYRKWLKGHYSNFENKKLTWLEKPVLIYAIFWIIWIPTRVMDIFVLDDTARPYYFNLGFLVLALITCWMGFKGYLTAQTNTVGFLKDQKQKVKHNTDQSELQAIAETLQQQMLDKKHYLDSELTLATLAKRIGYPQKSISKALNNCLHQSFHEFVNTYRVEAFKRNIERDEFKHLSLLGVALESGFGSKSTFNLVFKSSTGQTPKKYRDRLLKNKS